MNKWLIREQQGSFSLLLLFLFPPQLVWVPQLFSSGAPYLQTSKNQQIWQSAPTKGKDLFSSSLGPEQLIRYLRTELSQNILWKKKKKTEQPALVMHTSVRYIIWLLKIIWSLLSFFLSAKVSRELVHCSRVDTQYSRLTAGPRLHSEASHNTWFTTVTVNDIVGKFSITKVKSYLLEYSFSNIHPNTFRLLHTTRWTGPGPSRG